METTALCFQGTCRIYSCLSKCSLPFLVCWLGRLRLFLFFPSPRVCAVAPVPGSGGVYHPGDGSRAVPTS